LGECWIDRSVNCWPQNALRPLSYRQLRGKLPFPAQVGLPIPLVLNPMPKAPPLDSMVVILALLASYHAKSSRPLPSKSPTPAQVGLPMLLALKPMPKPLPLERMVVILKFPPPCCGS